MTVPRTGAKRQNGQGSLERLPNGRARLRVVVGGRRRQLGPIYETEEEARRMLAAHNAELASGGIVNAEVVSFADFGSEWLDGRALHGSPSRERVKNIRTERSRWARHVLPSSLAQMAVSSIRPRDVQAFVDWLGQRESVHTVRKGKGESVHRPTGKRLSARTRRNALGLVRLCLDEAVRHELLETNPAALVRVPRRGRKTDLDDNWLRKDEVDALLGCEKLSLRDRTAYACAIGLALRLNDLKSLRVSDVHLGPEHPGPHVAITVAKSERFHRIPVLPWLEPWLRAHIDSLPANATWLFPNPQGERYSKGYTFNWRGKQERGHERPTALELAGVAHRIRFHDLRGTCTTHLALGTWDRRWSLHEIQQMLAHSDQRVTERYVKRTTDAIADAAASTLGGPTVAPSPDPGGPTVAPALPMVAHGALSLVSVSARDPSVGRVGVEPTTVGLKARCSAN